MKKVAINGFGRIGRMVFRKLMEDKEWEIAAINASYSPEQLAHLIQYDSVHGTFPFQVSYNEQAILLNDREILLLNKRNPTELPWEKLEVDYVIEATGAFRTKELVNGHIQAGAKKVIVTAPAKDDMKMIVMGVNEQTYKGESVISNASCTTNCLAPLLSVIHDEFSIQNGLMTTVHSYTNDQRVLDNPHKDLRRARASATNMIPTSTGAAKAIGQIIPSLSGKLNGLAIRVPTVNVSLVDVVIDVEKEVTKELVNEALKKGSEKLKGVLDYNELPLVSSDYMTNAHSAIVDGLSTMVIADKKIKLLAWYDNEWGYSCRVVDLLNYIASYKEV